nr:hypothetical protein [Tanacetum cinerariifolium]
MTDFLTVGALRCTLSIMVIVALRAQRQKETKSPEGRSYLQNEHYALWEVIKFGDSYKAPPEETGKGPASESSAKKKGRTVLIITEDMQKRRNDVKARTTLLLALLNEHQLRFSKYETAKELWEAILKTFGGNEATKKTKKNQLKLQYGNFKAEGSETLEQTFNRLQAISYMANEEENHAHVAEDEVPTEFALMAKSSSSSGNEVEARLVEFKEHEIKFCEKIRGLERDVEIRDNKIEYVKNELEQTSVDEASRAKEKESLDNKLTVPPPPAQIYSPLKKALSWTGLPEFVDDIVTDYSRPTPSIDA